MKEAKRVSESAAEQVQLVLSSHINGYKRLFGGQLMAWIDMLGGVIARRHAEHEVTTACIDNLQFKKAVTINSTLVLKELHGSQSGYLCGTAGRDTGTGKHLLYGAGGAG